ncbi:unnamed protein product [Rotaria sp. Silwood1]|nr:unnamed protein product [Rotaria sp. Silwood1]
MDLELESRLLKTTTAFNILRHVIWHGKNVSIEAKLRIFRSCVLPILLYENEVWSLTVMQEKRIDTFYMKCLRTLLSLNLEDRVPNEKFLQLCGQPKIEEIMCRNRLRLFGHANSMESAQNGASETIHYVTPNPYESNNGHGISGSDQATTTKIIQNIFCVLLLISFCQFKNNCNITKTTRNYCSSCRLKKCFALGMDPKLIRTVPATGNVSKNIQHIQTIENKQIKLPTPLPLGLLRNDRSTLTTNEWTLLSNFLHLYDEQNHSIRIQYSLNELSSLPPKLRSKPLQLMKLLRELYTNVGPLIEHTPDFYTLHVHVRQILIKQNLFITGLMGALFACREINIFQNMTAINVSNLFFGFQFMIECRQNIARYDPNGNLIKILIFILAYSSNCSVVKYHNQVDISFMSSSINLVHIQNLYVTILWKYLVYLYGFKEAVLRFTQLVKNVVDLIDLFNRRPSNDIRDHMIDMVVTETERKLVIGD